MIFSHKLYTFSHYQCICFGNKFQIFDLKSQSLSPCQPMEFPNGYIRSLDYSNEKGLLVIVSNDKKLWLYDAQTFQVKWTRSVIKRSVAVKFDPDSKHILVADKFGDVYSMAVESPTSPIRLLLGHVSVLIDMIFSKNGKYILTSDRNEKIRVSHYPQCFEIESFCLGHSEFVSRMVFYNSDILISGGGDGYLCVWNYMNGQLLYKSDIPLHKSTEGVINLTVHGNELFLLREGSCVILVFDISNIQSELKFKRMIECDSILHDVAVDAINSILWFTSESGIFTMDLKNLNGNLQTRMSIQGDEWDYKLESQRELRKSFERSLIEKRKLDDEEEDQEDLQEEVVIKEI